jgi:MFS family permease
MKESPIFTKLKSEGKTSINPLKESFAHKANLKMVLLALFGATMGQGVVWYTGQFYAQSFIENVCKVDFDQSRTILIWAILFGTPFFVVFGAWSDKIGRKWIMIVGMLLAVVSYKYLFSELLNTVDVKNKVEVLEKKEVKTTLTAVAGSTDSLRKVITKSFYADGLNVTEAKTDTLYTAQGKKTLKPEVKLSKTMGDGDYWRMVFLVWIMIVYVTMVYGPIAAFLVELFPTKIRYTSMSLPYHIGNGVFGGLTPFIATLFTTIYTNDKTVGLTYPIVVAAVCMVIGAVYIQNRVDPEVNL